MSHNFYTTYLNSLYGTETGAQVEKHLRSLVEKFRPKITIPKAYELTQRDIFLITYADQVQREGESPLLTLADFCDQRLKRLVNTVHLLPFYPWSSDDGFAVKDYTSVDSRYGTWQDVEHFRPEFKLMFDAVVNHASTQGDWFQAFLRDEPAYRDFFITVEDDPDLSRVVRPRALPLLHEYPSVTGPRKVWTTFSVDQADLNYHNPEVLLAVMEVLLDYVSRGAAYLRLDAIAFLWKEIGTTCLNLPQTHTLVKLIRAVMDDVAPHVRLITETNIPHEQNISYFGDGTDEAHLVYNFTLPPLVLHTFLSGDASMLSEWAGTLETPSVKTAFFNFLASHDGIGINPVRGILPQATIDRMIDAMQAHGGRISYKTTAHDTQQPYEMNINYFDALSDPAGEEPLELQVKRFLASQAILLSLAGVPGIYFHSLVGSRNWQEGVAESGQNRRINREKLKRAVLERELQNPAHLRANVFRGYAELLRRRAASAAFNPAASQQILNAGRGIFALRRVSLDGKEQVTCLHNVTAERQDYQGRTLEPYQVLWLNH